MTKLTLLARKCAAGAAIGGLVAGATFLGQPGVAAGAQHRAPAAVSPSVPVVSCGSTYVGSPLSGPTEPTTERTTLSPGVASKLAFYTDRKRTLPPILGPRGWSCEVMIASDGTISVHIYPRGTKPQPPASGRIGIVAGSDSVCQGCVYDTVCPFDPGAARALGFSGLPCSPLAKGEVVTWEQGSPKDNKPPVHDIIGFVIPGYQARTGSCCSTSSRQGAWPPRTSARCRRPSCPCAKRSWAAVPKRTG